MARIRNRRLVAASVVAGVLAAGLGTTLALWQAQDSTAVALHGARHAFQARHLEGDSGRIRVTDPDMLDLTIESSAISDRLESGRTAYVPFRLYGAVEGGGAMTYRFAGVDGQVLLEHARVALWRVDDAATQCSAEGLQEGERLYPAGRGYGPFADMVPDAATAADDDPLHDQLVPSTGDFWGLERGRHDYCLELRLLGSYYENTASATGTTSDGVEVTASDSWDGTFVPEIPVGDQTIIHFERWVGRGQEPGVSPDVSPDVQQPEVD